MPDRDDDVDERVRVLDEFTAAYGDALRRHLDATDPRAVSLPDDMGHRALLLGISMLQLVGRHLEVCRVLVDERGPERVSDIDDFLSAVLAAFDNGGEDGPSPVPVHRDRVEWLRGLSDAYLAIAAGATLDERVAEVCVQARRFLGAVDARLVFGREGDDQPEHPAGDRISTQLLGSAGLLTVFAVPGRRWTTVEHSVLQQLAALISAPINDARRLESAERAGQLGSLLGGVVEPGDVLSRFRTRGPDLMGADRIVLRTVGDDEAADDEVPDDVASAREFVAQTREAHFLTDRPESDPGVWAVLPIVSASATIGVLAAQFDDPQPFDEVQQSFLADITRRLAAALDRSQVFANEQVARREAERSSLRWRDLQGLAADLATAATGRRVAQTLLRRVLSSGHADGGLLAMYASRPQVEVLAQARSLRSSKWEEASDLVAALADADRRASADRIDFVGVDALPDELRRRLTADAVVAIAGVPIVAGTRVVGMLVLTRTAAMSIDAAEDVELLEAQLSMAGATLQRAARYDSEHTIADTLQRSLLALPPIDPKRLAWSVLYRAGSAGLAGGDWYDLIELTEDRIAIVVGDIVGRGVAAAASMGQLRSAVRALAMHIDEPADLVAAVDQFTISAGQGRYSSLAYLVLDTATGQLNYTIAGHPPPMLHLPDGTASAVTGGGGPVVGVRCVRTAAVRHLSPGTGLVVYTDGLVERRGESIDVGIARLTSSVAAFPVGCDPAQACRLLVEGLLPNGSIDEDGGQDDVAIVVVELTA